MADNGLFDKSFRHPSGASDNAVFNGSRSLAASTSAAYSLASSSSLAESSLVASEPFAKFGIGHDIGLAKVMFRW